MIETNSSRSLYSRSNTVFSLVGIDFRFSENNFMGFLSFELSEFLKMITFTIKHVSVEVFQVEKH